jgi:hypothetical protein
VLAKAATMIAACSRLRFGRRDARNSLNDAMRDLLRKHAVAARRDFVVWDLWDSHARP